MIEPCPICGEDLVTVNSYPAGEQWDYWTVCGGCEAQGPLVRSEKEAIDKHNRLSRIVRAAEALVKAREALVKAFADMDTDYPHFFVSKTANELTRDVDDANRALTKAVEGGAE